MAKGKCEENLQSSTCFFSVAIHFYSVNQLIFLGRSLYYSYKTYEDEILLLKANLLTAFKPLISILTGRYLAMLYFPLKLSNGTLFFPSIIVTERSERNIQALITTLTRVYYDDTSSRFAPSVASYVGIPASLIRINEAERAREVLLARGEEPYKARWERRGKDLGWRCWRRWRDPQQEPWGLYQAAPRPLEVPEVSIPSLKLFG